MMKRASIIKNKLNYWIYSQSKTSDGLWIAALPFIKQTLDVSSDLLIDKLLAALNDSKPNVPHPKDWKVSKRDFLNGFGAKSLSIIFKESVQCEVSKNENIISFVPTKNIGGKGRFDHLPEFEKKISCDANTDEIYDTLEQAFAKCS